MLDILPAVYGAASMSFAATIRHAVMRYATVAVDVMPFISPRCRYAC